MAKTKSSAVTGSPLDHLAFLRNLKTQVVASVCFQLSATPGTVLPFASLAVKPSNKWRVRLLAPTDSASAGSSVSVSEPLLRIRVWVELSCTPGGMTAAWLTTKAAARETLHTVCFKIGFLFCLLVSRTNYRAPLASLSAAAWPCQCQHTSRTRARSDGGGNPATRAASCRSGCDAWRTCMAYRRP